MDDFLSDVIEGVQQTTKYQALNTGVINRVALQEIQSHRNKKEAIHQVRSRLHQISGAFFPGKKKIDAWQTQLAQLPAGLDDPACLEFCRNILAEHHSTAERLPFLEKFYAEVLGRFRQPLRLLDLGCGLNPLSIGWFPKEKISHYSAVDMHADLAAFLNFFFDHFQIPGIAVNSDVLSFPYSGKYDLAFLFKLLPVLEHQDKKEIQPWLSAIPATNLVISFPIRSLGGRNKGMQTQYAGRFDRLAAELNWTFQEILFPNEILFLIERRP